MTETQLQQIETAAAQRGIRFTAADYDKIRAAAEQGAETHKQRMVAAAQSEDWTTRLMRWYPRLLGAIQQAGNILITISQAVIVSLGVPIVLVLLLVVEQRRVAHGIELFETSPALAAFAAWALVVLNLVLEVVAHHIERTHNYEAALARRWSLRLFARNAAYWLGIGDKWSEQTKSPAAWAHTLLWTVTMTILALALAGSMRSVIETQGGAWHQAIIAIVTESSLLQMMTWLGGLLFAAAAVLSAQALSRYVAIRTVEVLASMPSTSADDDALDHAMDSAAAIAARALLSEKLSKAAAKEKAAQMPPNPFGHTAHAEGGAEFTMVTNGRVPQQHSANGANGNGHHS